MTTGVTRIIYTKVYRILYVDKIIYKKSVWQSELFSFKGNVGVKMFAFALPVA